MKYLIIAIVAVVGLAWLNNAVNSSVDNSNKETNAPALAAIRKEPKVKEAIITEANVLYVSVVDDGTRQDAYAEYLCTFLQEHESTAKHIKIVKVNSTKDSNPENAYGVLLGEGYCQ